MYGRLRTCGAILVRAARAGQHSSGLTTSGLSELCVPSGVQEHWRIAHLAHVALYASKGAAKGSGIKGGGGKHKAAGGKGGKDGAGTAADGEEALVDFDITPFASLCLELSVDTPVDLVFLEFTVNNGFDDRIDKNRNVMDMERLARRVLALPGQPAVIFMQVPVQNQAGYPDGHPKNPRHEHWEPFYRTSEDAVGAVSQYYDVQALSLRTALYDLAVRQSAEGFLWEQVFFDHHPGDHGHKIMADLAVFMLQQTALSLLHMPYGKADADMAEAPLPAPMYAGNDAPPGAMCLMADTFRSVVASSEGFEYINEGSPAKPKPGYVATQPGARLVMRLNTDRAAQGDPTGGVHVFVHHLKSYQGMGVAALSCTTGCTCTRTEVNGHINERVSQLYMARLEVSQHRACEITVEVLNQTESGGSKFKVAGLVVSERTGNAGIFDDLWRTTQAFVVREHTGERLQTLRSQTVAQVDNAY